MQIFFVLCIITMYIFKVQEIIRVFFPFRKPKLRFAYFGLVLLKHHRLLFCAVSRDNFPPKAPESKIAPGSCCGNRDVLMHFLCALILNSIHPPDEQTNKAHRQIDGEPYFMISF